MFSSLTEKIKGNPTLKRMALNFIVHPRKARPQWWIRPFVRFYTERGRGSVIYRSVRKDLLPNHRFRLGRGSIIEDFSALNNGVGDILIGDECRLGLGGTIIGPVTLEDGVIFGQHCFASGLIHHYEDPCRSVLEQGVEAAPVVIGRNTYIGANCVVVAGVTIGEHCVIGAGSVVTRSLPPYTVCVGAPARPVKKYDFELKRWVKIDA